MTFLRRSTPLLIAASAILLLLVLASSSAPVSAEQERILKKKNKKNKLPKASKSPAGKGKGSAIITIQPSTEPSTVPSASLTETPDPCLSVLESSCPGEFTCGEECFIGLGDCCGPAGISATCAAGGAFFFGPGSTCVVGPWV